MIRQRKKEIEVAKRIMIAGESYDVGDVVSVTEEDALYLIASGRAKSHSILSKEEDAPGVRVQQVAWKSGPYRVEITRPCLVRGQHCEPGEIISVTEEEAGCLAVSSRGKIVGRPPEEETIEMKVARMVEERLQGHSR